MDTSRSRSSNNVHCSQATDDTTYEVKYRTLVQKYNRLVQRYNQLKLERSMQTSAQVFHNVEDVIDTASIINMDVLGY